MSQSTAILFGYTNGGNYVDYIPPKTTPIDSQVFNCDFVIGDAENVTVNILDGTFVTHQALTNAINTHNTDSSAHTPILNAHNADVNAHSPILNAIKAITGMSTYNVAPSKTIAEIIPLLGFGGIVAQKLEDNGYVKFANGLTLQFGLTGDIPKNGTYQVNYPIAFTNLLYAGGFAIINGDASNQDEIKMYNLPNQYNMTLLNTADNYTAKTYWLAIGLI